MNQKRFILPLAASAVILLVLSSLGFVSAANNSSFSQTINPGVLSTDILDATQTPVASPTVAMTAKTMAFTCQSGAGASTGALGAAAQRVYVVNPDGADNGWTLTLAATSGATALRTSGSNTFDFNDATSSGCTDGADADVKGGQLTINPAASTLTTDCTACTVTNVTKGSSSAFAQGTLDNITLLSASAASDDIWRGYITGIGLSQVIPAETPAGTYTLNMTMTATAS